MEQTSHTCKFADANTELERLNKDRWRAISICAWYDGHNSHVTFLLERQFLYAHGAP